MPKAKPVSLHPLNFDEAIKALIRVEPERDGLTKHAKRPRKIKQKVKKQFHS